jgi:cbb3-type cytochrome oxidase subunit 1
MRVESVSLPLRFILTALGALVLGIAALIAKPDILAMYHYNQWVLATTHIFTLGWITSVIMGAMYQLVPVALETRLYSQRLARWQFVVHIVGWPSLVAMF